MVTETDFIRCVPTAAMQAFAIEYAGRSLNYTYDRMGYGQDCPRLLRIVVGIVNEQSFEDYLRIQGHTINKLGRTHWRNIDKAEFQIGKKLVDIKGYHVYPTPERVFPDWFLDTEGLVPYGQLKHDGPNAFVQAFLTAQQVNNSPTHCYVTCLPKNYSDRWPVAQQVTLSYTSTPVPSMGIKIYGESAAGIGQSETDNYDIDELMRLGYTTDTVDSQQPFSSVQCLMVDQKPQVSLTFSNKYSTVTISPNLWCDLWLYSPVIYFTAWGSDTDFNKGSFLKVGSVTRVYTAGTRTANQSILIKNLRPVANLFL